MLRPAASQPVPSQAALGVDVATILAAAEHESGRNR